MFRAAIISMLFSFSFFSHSQISDTLSYAEQLAALEAEMDSLSIFNLIESMLSLESSPSSELNIHASFTSSVTSAGRDYDINQKGLSPGLSYYHKSGIYADLSGYWNSDIEPNYNPTVFSLGYLSTFNENWSYNLDYEKWLFNPGDTSENPLTNSIGASLNYDFKFIDVGLDYSLLFGNKTAHRIIGSLSSSISLGKWSVFDNIRLYPSGNIQYGNATITQLRITRQQLNEQWANIYQQIIDFSDLNDFQQQTTIRSIETAFENGRITERRRDRLIDLINTAQNLTAEEIQELQDIVDNGYEESILENSNAFGLMNYSFSLPIALSIKNLSIILSYTYSIPVALPGEFFEVDPVGFFGASISYRIPFK